jgi:cobalt-zinc-cadmium efflux system membrane fusion protein
MLVVGIAAGIIVARVLDGPRSTGRDAAGKVENAIELPAGVVEISVEAQQNGGIQVTRAGRRSLPAAIQVTGVVTPVESRVAHVRPLSRGVVARVSVTLGQRVRLDEPLVTIDTIELGERVGEFLTEAAALRQTDTDLNVRRRALERAEALIAIEGISRQELDLRRAEFQNAEAAVASQRARLARVEEQLHRFGLSDADIAALDPSRQGGAAADASGGHRVASHNVIRAPLAGVITRYDVAPGELVHPEEELFTVTNLSEVWVLADVYEKDIARLRTNREVVISVDAYPGRVFTGRLTYVSDQIDPRTRTASVRCVVDNADGALKLDMFARVTIPVGDVREALAVPMDAVQQIDGQTVVFERQSDTRFVRRNVQTGIAAGADVEIVSGVEPGVEVVSSGSFYLKTALLRERIGDEH